MEDYQIFFLLVFVIGVVGIALLSYRLYRAIMYSNRILNRKTNGFVSLLFQTGIPIIKELLYRKSHPTSSGYFYQRKPYYMTQSEHEFFSVLESAISDRMYIFPQVNLTTILNEKINGQSWKGARSHIDKKSVDFVLCDKEKVAPLVAIELDGLSHEREDREERDQEVERIFANANFPLLRIPRQPSYDPISLRTQIDNAITPS